MVDTTIDLQTIPLSALRLKSRNYLATYLDAIKILPSSDGCSRDWRGIYQRSGLGNQYMSFLADKPNPTIELIKILENELKDMTFGDFRHMLGVIDRWDVVDDTYELFGESVNFHFGSLSLNQSNVEAVRHIALFCLYSVCVWTIRFRHVISAVVVAEIMK